MRYKINITIRTTFLTVDVDAFEAYTYISDTYIHIQLE